MTSISGGPTACSRPRRWDVARLEVCPRDGQRRRLGGDAPHAFQALFPLITVVLCFLHGFPEDSRQPLPQGPQAAPPRVGRLPRRHRGGVSTPDGRASAMVCHPNLDHLGGEMLGEAVGQGRSRYAVAYDHPGCHRTSNAGGPADEPAVPAALMYAGRGCTTIKDRPNCWLAGLGVTAELPAVRAAGPSASGRSKSPAHRLNGKRYHEHWLHNLMTSTSMMGFRNPKPAIR